ncbi:MAG: LacI family DNA-binding transcriptional regulator [Protaetiibacter sp.]
MTTNDGEAEGTARPRRRATSEDVARASGVSRATVSYVLNNAEGRNISEQTRRLVRETAKRLGHVPYAPARALSSGRSDIVLALVPGFTLGYVFDQGLEALDIALARRGAALMVHRHLESVRDLPELWKLISPDLVVATGGFSESELELMRDSHTKFIDIGSIVPHRSLGQAQASHVVSRGHRRIGFGMPADENLHEFAEQRLAGVRDVCRAHGLPDPEVRTIAFDPDGAGEAIEGWRGHPDPVTAVCAHNDDIALVVLSTAISMRLRVPADLAVMGIDNIPMSGVGLTTIGIDTPAWSRTVVRYVLDSLERKPITPPTEPLFGLVERTSV